MEFRPPPGRGRRTGAPGLRAADGPAGPARIAAMAYLEHFYEGLGFTRQSDVFDKEGVPHVTMLYTAR